MAVRQPDGSYTGSLRVGVIPEAATPVEPEEIKEPEKAPENKEVKDGAR